MSINITSIILLRITLIIGTFLFLSAYSKIFNSEEFAEILYIIATANLISPIFTFAKGTTDFQISKGGNGSKFTVTDFGELIKYSIFANLILYFAIGDSMANIIFLGLTFSVAAYFLELFIVLGRAYQGVFFFLLTHNVIVYALLLLRIYEIDYALLILANLCVNYLIIRYVMNRYSINTTRDFHNIYIFNKEKVNAVLNTFLGQFYLQGMLVFTFYTLSSEEYTRLGILLRLVGAVLIIVGLYSQNLTPQIRAMNSEQRKTLLRKILVKHYVVIAGCISITVIVIEPWIIPWFPVLRAGEFSLVYAAGVFLILSQLLGIPMVIYARYSGKNTELLVNTLCGVGIAILAIFVDNAYECFLVIMLALALQQVLNIVRIK